MVLEELNGLNQQYITYKGDKSINKSVVKFQEYLDRQKGAGVPEQREQQEQSQRAKTRSKKLNKKNAKSQTVKVTKRVTRSQTKKKKIESQKKPEPEPEEPEKMSEQAPNQAIQIEESFKKVASVPKNKVKNPKFKKGILN